LLLKLSLRLFLFFDDFKSDEGGTTIEAVLILVGVAILLLSRGERERERQHRARRKFEMF
jgi:hypothetical protein